MSRRVTVYWDGLPEWFRRFVTDAFQLGPDGTLHFAKRPHYDDETDYARFREHLADNGGKRNAAIEALSIEFEYTPRHVRRRIRRIEKGC